MDYNTTKQRIVIILGLVMIFQNGILFSQTNKPKLEASLVVASETSYEFKTQTLQKSELLIKPEVVLKLNHRSKFVFKGQLYSEFMDNLEPGIPNEESVSTFSKRLFMGNTTNLELREFYYYKSFNAFKLTIGKQQIVWGETDGLKLLDVVNPQNFREFILDDFEDSRIPLWSLKADFNIKDIGVQFIWIPDNTYHIIPSFDAPFFTKSIFKAPPENIPANFNKLDRPNRFIKDSDIGLKLSSFKKGWDLSLNYFYYYEDLPVFYTFFRSQTTSIEVSLTYERQQLVGGTFNKVFGSSTFRGELVYIFNQNFTSNNRNDGGVEQSGFYKSALGLDYIKGENVLSIQLFNEWITESISPYNRDLFETMTSMLISRELLNDSVKAEVLWVHSVNHNDGFITPQVSYWISTNTQLLVNAHVFYGEDNLLFGQFKNRSRLSLGFKWSY
ncbi:DUF1302 family protein [Algibacter mikhailovii]|uniref:Uncharacterized protein n=1 Tax=Algibacter mikhailovii TaxID=425498 RepID=A0A918QTB6_9FLAO|nr:DUF1302 family protein [Algibacter mikhailovii]GGZ68445.1 hypothetical protein GCM10007028_01700 [Algibacter mikhailovii]